MRGENILSVPRRQGQGQRPGPGAGFVVLRHKLEGSSLRKTLKIITAHLLGPWKAFKEGPDVYIPPASPSSAPEQTDCLHYCECQWCPHLGLPGQWLPGDR